jgi:23S rRNA pseudouridine1911/1915/1917 synthase
VTHTVEPRDQGKTLLDWLCARTSLSLQEALAQLQGRKVRVNGTLCSDPGWRLRAGSRVEFGQSPERKRRGRPDPSLTLRAQKETAVTIRHVDDAIVVVDKPAGLTTVRHAEETAEFGRRGKRYLPATLADLLPGLLASRSRGKPVPVRPVHRLDRDTTGLVVFARTPQAEGHLGTQFREHSIERLYLALVRGRAASGRIESWLVRDRGDGRRGSGKPGEGQRAVTHVRVVEELGDFTLVECRLETGRTHQVRIHLGEAGTPLCGERVYDRPLNGRPAPDASGMARVALHAATLGLSHPTTGRRLRWTSPLPRDIDRLLKRLRRGAGSQ